MFTVRANGTQYSMSFEQRSVKRLGREGFEDVVETVCRIYQQDLTVIAAGYAQRAPGDEEDTPKALEYAMRRALEGVWVGNDLERKAFRGAFWTALRAAIWNEWKPEELEAEELDTSREVLVDIAGESPLPPPEVIVDAIPVESIEVKRLRKEVARNEAFHGSGGSRTCDVCAFVREKLNQALRA